MTCVHYIYPLFKELSFNLNKEMHPHNIAPFLSSYSFLLACLVEVSRVSTADPISLVMKRSFFRSSTTSRQLNLSGKLLEAPHGLVKKGGHPDFIHYELQSVRLISEVLKTSYNEPFHFCLKQVGDANLCLLSMFQSNTNCLNAFESLEITRKIHDF